VANFPVAEEPVKLIFVDARVARDPWSKAVISAQSLEDAWWEDMLTELGEFESAVLSVGPTQSSQPFFTWISRRIFGSLSNIRWLDDDDVVRQQRRGDLASREHDREIPGHDSSHYA
jgi:hypothetical protein